MELLGGRKIPEKQDITPHSLHLNEKSYSAEQCEEVPTEHLLQALSHPSNEDRTELRATYPLLNSLP